jgi:hypothetical protein
MTLSASSFRSSSFRSSAALQNVATARSRSCTRQSALREPHPRQRVAAVDLDHLLEDLDGFAIATSALIARRDLVPGAERVAREPELRVDLREPRRHVPVAIGQLRRVRTDQLPNLLVDGDGLEREALGGVVLPHPVIGGDRVRVGLHARLQVPDLQQGPGVPRVLLDDLLILLDRPVVLSLVDVLLSGQEDLLAFGRHCCSERTFGCAKRTGLSGKF